MADLTVEQRRRLLSGRLQSDLDEIIEEQILARQFAPRPPQPNPLLSALGSITDSLGETPDHKAFPYRLLDLIGEGASELLEGLGAPGQGVRSLLTGKPAAGPPITGEDVTGLHPGPFQPDFSPLTTAILNPKRTANLLTEVVTDPISFLPLGFAKRGAQEAKTMGEVLKPRLALPAPAAMAEDRTAQLARVAELQELLAGGPKPMVTPGGKVIPSGGPADVAALMERVRPGTVRPELQGLPAPADFLATPGGGITGSRSAADQAALMERVSGQSVMDLTKAAEVRSFDLTKQSDGSYRLVGPGGREAVAANEAELQTFLVEQPVRPPQPIELKTSSPRTTLADILSGEQAAPQSTFEKAVKGEALGEADKANLEVQRAFFKDTDRLSIQTDTDLKPSTTMDDILEGKASMPPIGGGSQLTPPGKLRGANPWANPVLQWSPLIQKVTEDFARSEMGLKLELPNAMRFRQERLLSEYGENKELRAKAMSYVEGELKEGEAGPKAVAAGNAWNEVKKDIARRLALNPRNKEEAEKAHFYATHVTDMDAIYATLRPEILKAKTVAEFVGEEEKEAAANWLRIAMGSEKRFQEIKAVVGKNPNWKDVPGLVKRDIRNLANFDQYVEKWEDLPSFITKRLPKEAFSPYLLPRKGGVPYVHDLDEVFLRYVPTMLRKIHYDPAMQKWDPVINALPGEPIMGTEKGYLTKFVNIEMGRELPWDSKALKTITDKINDVFGKEMVTLSTTQDFATLMRSGSYRGLIGPDSALINMTQTLNDVVEHGMFLSPMYRYVANRPMIKKYNTLFGDYVDQAREWTPSELKGGMREKVLRLDEWMSRFWLTPMAITEGFNRGMSLGGSIERAIREGKKGNEVLVNAMAAASEIWPNPTIPDTVLTGLLRDVPKTQFTSNLSAQRTPYFRGPLGRMSTILTTFPVNQAQFLTRGFYDAVTQHDGLKGLRFTVALGAFATLPWALSEAFGIDVRRQFGIDSILGQLTFPFWKMLYNGVQAVTGENPISQAKAQEEFGKFWTYWALPQKRYEEKIEKVLGNLDRGFAVDSYGRYLYESTPMGEILKLAGVNPEEGYDVRQLTKSITNQAMEHRLDRRKAITDLLMQQDPTAAQAYSQKWGRAITMQDLLKAKKDAMKTPQQRALAQFPKRMRGTVLQAAEEEAGVSRE